MKESLIGNTHFNESVNLLILSFNRFVYLRIGVGATQDKRTQSVPKAVGDGKRRLAASIDTLAFVGRAPCHQPRGARDEHVHAQHRQPSAGSERRQKGAATCRLSSRMLFKIFIRQRM